MFVVSFHRESQQAGLNAEASKDPKEGVYTLISSNIARVVRDTWGGHMWLFESG